MEGAARRLGRVVALGPPLLALPAPGAALGDEPILVSYCPLRGTGMVLSRETGYDRDYDRSAYAGYAASRRLMFPAPRDRPYHPKTHTLGLRVPGELPGRPPSGPRAPQRLKHPRA